MTVTLEFLGTNGKTKRIKLEADTMIGRGKSCRLRIGSERVSRRHCLVRVTDGVIRVLDLGSTNGTFLNGQRLTPYDEFTVEDGAELSIGPAKARVCLDRSHLRHEECETDEQDQAPHHLNPDSLAQSKNRGKDTVRLSGTETADTRDILANRETLDQAELRIQPDDSTEFRDEFPP